MQSAVDSESAYAAVKDADWKGRISDVAVQYLECSSSTRIRFRCSAVVDDVGKFEIRNPKSEMVRVGGGAEN